MVYGVGVAAKSSLQRSYPQNLGDKGLTGSFWDFLLFLYRIAILAQKGPLLFFWFSPRIFFLDFFLRKTVKNGGHAALRVSCACSSITIVRRGRVILRITEIRGQRSGQAEGVLSRWAVDVTENAA
jgi:hypothetical protein